jgi:hypothetical protein
MYHRRKDRPANSLCASPLALISFGFTIAKFYQFLHEAHGLKAPPAAYLERERPGSDRESDAEREHELYVVEGHVVGLDVGARRVAANGQRWWRNSGMLIHVAFPIRYFDELGLPRLAA